MPVSDGKSKTSGCLSLTWCLNDNTAQLFMIHDTVPN